LKKKYLLAIDIGTSSTKTLLTDFFGNRIAQYTASYETIARRPGYVEQNAESTWWAGAKAGIAACVSAGGVNTAEIAGICASGMVPNLCPVDARGNSTRLSILYRDNRAVEQIERLNQEFGWGFTSQDIIPKLLWIKENEPDHYKKIRYVLNSHSFISYKLTGRFSVDHDTATIYGAVYDIASRSWRQDRMERIGLNPDVLPPLVWSTDIVGGVTKQAAAETGLAENTPVISGTGDSFTALVGCGAVLRKEGLIYLGTAATFLGLRESLDDARGECVFGTGKALFLGNVLTGGEITHWFKDSALKGRAVDYPRLEEEASAVSPGSDGLIALPHLLGKRTPELDSLATGVLFGLTNAHTIGHIYRSLLEGVAFALKDSYEAKEFPLDQLTLMGGGCSCKLWRQIIADVLNRELSYSPKADNALGTAFLAGMGLGVFDSYTIIKNEWLDGAETIRPIAESAARYQEIFPFYQELDQGVKNLYKRHRIYFTDTNQ